MVQISRAEAAREWKAGWPVVFAAVVGYTAANIHTMTVGALMTPLHHAFGWSRAEISFAISAPSLAGVVTGPIVGKLLDRYGARAVGSIGLPLYCAAVAAAALTGPAIWTWYLAWSLVSIVYFSASTLIWTQGVASRFEKQRGLALAICLSGVAISASVFPPAAAYLAQHFGWRSALLAIALTCLVVGLTVTRLFFFDAKALARRQAGSAGIAAAAAPLRTGLTLRQTLRSPVFWRLIAMVLFVGGTQGFMAGHTQAIMIDHGIGMTAAAAYAAASGPAIIVGRLVCGYFLDRFHGRYVAALDLAMMSGSAFLMWTFSGQPSHAILACVLLGLGTGAEIDVLTYVASRYFGLRSYGAVMGVFIGVSGLSYGLGPLLGGLAFDHLGSYTPILLTVGVGLAANAIAMITLPPYPAAYAPGLAPAPAEREQGEAV